MPPPRHATARIADDTTLMRRRVLRSARKRFQVSGAADAADEAAAAVPGLVPVENGDAVEVEAARAWAGRRRRVGWGVGRRRGQAGAGWEMVWMRGLERRARVWRWVQDSVGVGWRRVARPERGRRWGVLLSMVLRDLD